MLALLDSQPPLMLVAPAPVPPQQQPELEPPGPEQGRLGYLCQALTPSPVQMALARLPPVQQGPSEPPPEQQEQWPAVTRSPSMA